MSSLNKVMLIGRLGRDPELRYTQSGTPVCALSLATDESYQDRDGNKVDRTEWHKVQVWQKPAENAAHYLAKGSLIFVEGKLATRKWQDQQGQDRYTTEIQAQRIQYLDFKNDSQGQNQTPRQGGQQRRPQSRQDDDLGPAFPSEASGMDDVPF